MTHSHTDSFERRARDLYLRAGPRVDPSTATQLRMARRNALAKGQRRPARWMVPAGAFAVVALAVVGVWQPLHGPTTRASMTATAALNADATAALPPDADQTDPALYQNLDFYAWLAQQPATAHATTGQ